jgi:hypothetical protein
MEIWTQIGITLVYEGILINMIFAMRNNLKGWRDIMNESINNFIQKAKTTFNQAYGHAKETLYSVTGTSSATVEQIAEYVRNHADTKVMKKSFIGVPLTFYELEQENMKYYLETNHDKILQLDVHSGQHTVISYRSYRDQLSLKTPVKFPELQNQK